MTVEWLAVAAAGVVAVVGAAQILVGSRRWSTSVVEDAIRQGLAELGDAQAAHSARLESRLSEGLEELTTSVSSLHRSVEFSGARSERSLAHMNEGIGPALRTQPACRRAVSALYGPRRGHLGP